ncbi:hypothetical protein AZE42_02620 [Rhizopogon vesiculosus]|uniref:Uncharacterized protein n=1 Tax=Rhizopogon vesiculosus TaxID=180088 RepID=A0A1J8PKL1_9AGAM|nr:hypothetical protein AZE42_02620 [Rhizopogon vesiculosus]
MIAHTKFDDPDSRSTHEHHRSTSTKFTAHCHSPFDMTVVSNDPSLWPLINYLRQTSYASGSFASLAVVIYDMGAQDNAYYERIIDVLIAFSSTNIRTRSRLIRLPEQPSH